MAGRENQGYLIAVISLVFVSLLLALGTFYGFSKANEAADNMAAAEKRLNLTSKLNQAHQIKAMVLQTMVGASDASVSEIETQISTLRNLSSGLTDESEREQVREIERQVTTLKERFDLAVQAYSSSKEEEDDEEITYQVIINGLTSSLAKMHNEFIIKDRQRLLAEQDKAKLEEDLNSTINRLNQEVASLEQNLQEEKETARNDKIALQNALDKNLNELRNAQRQHETVRSDLQTRLATSTGNERQLQENNETLKNRIDEMLREVFDRPDGEIIKTFARNNVVYIDLGLLHGLREGQAFAVYDRSVTNFEKGANKASIEVTRVFDSQSEARITMENPEIPILPGDFVLTPTWEPGQRVRIALAGIFDLDGDGRSDTDRLIQMVRSQGGEVAVWHDEEGQIQGKIDPSIRFLVLGDRPDLGIGSRSNPAVLAAMKELQKTAEDNAIQVIDFARLLRGMGVRSFDKVEVMSRSGRQFEFEPRSPESSLRSSDR